MKLKQRESILRLEAASTEWIWLNDLQNIYIYCNHTSFDAIESQLIRERISEKQLRGTGQSPWRNMFPPTVSKELSCLSSTMCWPCASADDTGATAQWLGF